MAKLVTGRIDDADDGSVGWRLRGIERECRFAAAHEEHVFADARADRIHRDQRTPGRLAGGGQRLQDEQLDPVEVGILHGRDHFACRCAGNRSRRHVEPLWAEERIEMALQVLRGDRG